MVRRQPSPAWRENGKGGLCWRRRRGVAASRVRGEEQLFGGAGSRRKYLKCRMSSRKASLKYHQCEIVVALSGLAPIGGALSSRSMEKIGGIGRKAQAHLALQPKGSAPSYHFCILACASRGNLLALRCFSRASIIILPAIFMVALMRRRSSSRASKQTS